MKKQNKYMVLVDYENSIQGELCLVAHTLTKKEALACRKRLIDEQEKGNVMDDFIILDPTNTGIKIVEYIVK
jgi:hypothetical protein